MRQSVIIDCFPESAARYRKGYAVVAIDVIRATTMAITAVAAGWRCYAVPNLEAARSLHRKLENAVLAGELGGDMPARFDMNNSPVELAARTDNHRPLILLSSSGTQLIYEAGRCETAYLACLRNYTALTEYLVGRHQRIAVIGAGSRGEFREEDEMCCAWIAEALMRNGYQAENGTTRERVNRWKDAPPAACLVSHSVDYLRRTRQLKDLNFILAHLDDLNAIFSLRAGQITMMPAAKQLPTQAVLKHTSTNARGPNVQEILRPSGREHQNGMPNESSVSISQNGRVNAGPEVALKFHWSDVPKEGHCKYDRHYDAGSFAEGHSAREFVRSPQSGRARDPGFRG